MPSALPSEMSATPFSWPCGAVRSITRIATPPSSSAQATIVGLPGMHGILTGAAIVFFAYIGFDAVSTTAEEAKNPKRDMPIGIIGSLIICTIIYIIVAAVFTGMIPFPMLVQTLSTQQAEPLTMAMKFNAMPSWMIGVVALGSVIAHTAVLLSFSLANPGSSLPWPGMDCFRHGSQKFTRNTERLTWPRSSPE